MPLIAGEREGRPLAEEFDYVVVGSGAAGATAARVLADTGRSVAVLEEGPAAEPGGFGDRLYPALKRLFRDMGAQTARGRAFIPVIQGRCLGGSTVVNSAIVWRIPEEVWRPWRDERGLGEALPYRALERAWELIEGELSAAPTPREVWGRNNALLGAGAERLGVSAAPTRRYARACRGSARCLTGCPFGAKQSMLVSYLPYALERGATVLTSARAERVLIEGGRAVGVSGSFLGGEAGAGFRLGARRAVLVAASAIQTPNLLAASGVRSPHLGRHFSGHPGTPIAGVFEDPVDLWTGATQGFDADEHRADPERRCKVETIALPPEMLFARLPGAGRRWLGEMARARHLALWAVQLRAHAEGSVRRGPWGADIRYQPEPRDMANLRRSLRFAAELLFAAGAREVVTGVHGMPERLISPDQARFFEEASLDPRAYTFILSHLFGTARMSVAPGDGVVGPDFGVHGLRGLLVIDSSVFPTNLGVNPQHPIMGVAWLAAERLAQAR